MGGTALLEVDFQTWVLGHAHDRAVLDGARDVRSRLRATGAAVFCLRYLDAEPGERADPLSPAASFLPGLEPQAGDLVLSKHSRDAFDNPDLESNLALRGIDRVVVDGLLTEHGVRLAVLSALARGYLVALAADACAGATRAAHDGAIHDMHSAGATLL